MVEPAGWVICVVLKAVQIYNGLKVPDIHTIQSKRRDITWLDETNKWGRAWGETG